MTMLPWKRKTSSLGNMRVSACGGSGLIHNDCEWLVYPR